MKRLFFLVLTLSTLLYSCSTSDEYHAVVSNENPASFTENASIHKMAKTADQSQSPILPKASTHIPLALSERKIIRNADISMEVKDLESSLFQIQMATEGRGGYIAGMNMQKNNFQILNDLIIKVPGMELNNLLQDIDKEAIAVDYRKMTSQDVTEEMVDIESRLKTKRDVHTRYTNILRNQAKSIEDVIYAEEQIRKLTEEIEAKEGRLNYLKHQTNLSTLKVKLRQEIPYEPEIVAASTPSFIDTFISNASFGWNGIVFLFLEFIRFWPLWLILIVFEIKRKKVFQRFV